MEEINDWSCLKNWYEIRSRRIASRRSFLRCGRGFAWKHRGSGWVLVARRWHAHEWKIVHGLWSPYCMAILNDVCNFSVFLAAPAVAAIFLFHILDFFFKRTFLMWWEKSCFEQRDIALHIVLDDRLPSSQSVQGSFWCHLFWCRCFLLSTFGILSENCIHLLIHNVVLTSYSQEEPRSNMRDHCFA